MKPYDVDSGAQARETIARCWPDLVLEDVDHLGRGASFYAYKVNGELVFRFPRRPDAGAELLRESLLLPRLRGRLNLEVPEVVHVGPRLHGGVLFLATAFLPGRILRPDSFVGLSKQAVRRFAGRLGRFMVALHSWPVASAEQCTLRPVDYQRMFEKTIRGSSKLLPLLGSRSRAYLESTVYSEWQAVAPVLAGRRALLHGDIGFGNVIYLHDAGNPTAVIDFGDAMIGHPAWDISVLSEDVPPDSIDWILDDLGISDRYAFKRLIRRLTEWRKVQHAIASLKNHQRKKLKQYLQQIDALAHSPLERPSF